MIPSGCDQRGRKRQIAAEINWQVESVLGISPNGSLWFQNLKMLTANTALCVRVSSEKHHSAGSRCWKCLTGWPRKKEWRGEALLSVGFLCSGDSLWAWESLLLTQMKLHDFLLACSNCLPHSSSSLPPPPSARTQSNSAPTTRRLCFQWVLCPS